MSWLRRVKGRPAWDGTTGPPRSANAASSFHLFWDAPRRAWTGAEAVLEVVVPPAVPALYFWALQVSFTQRGRAGGGAHLGLQWYPPHPGSTAANWGGYGPDGGELVGSASTLPSATGNVNTRDFDWAASRAYRLVIGRSDARDDGRFAWRGAITDLETNRETIVRELFSYGSHIESPMVWSEVFADCDAPGVEVRWRSLALRDEDGGRSPVTSVVANYQSVADGGCVTTDSAVVDGAFAQRTGTLRRTAQGARLTQQSRS